MANRERVTFTSRTRPHSNGNTFGSTPASYHVLVDGQKVAALEHSYAFGWVVSVQQGERSVRIYRGYVNGKYAAARQWALDHPDEILNAAAVSASAEVAIR
jgi:hypothetical protein